MGHCPPLCSWLFLPFHRHVDRPNSGRLVRRHTKALARVSLDVGHRLPSQPCRKLARIPADRPIPRAPVRSLDAPRSPVQRPALHLPPPDKPASARLPLHSPTAAGGCGPPISRLDADEPRGIVRNRRPSLFHLLVRRRTHLDK